MDAPLLSSYDSIGSSSHYDPPLHLIIRTCQALKHAYEKPKGYYRNIRELRIHLEEFKRPIFKAIGEDDFATQTKPESTLTFGWMGKFRSDPAQMISTLLDRMPRLNKLDIMLFPGVSISTHQCKHVETLIVSNSFVDEFAQIWNSCENIKHVTLDGIVPRLRPEDQQKNEVVYQWRSLANRSRMDFLNITYKSIITKDHFLPLLAAISSLREFHYEKFSNRIPLYYKEIHAFILSDEVLINFLQELRNLEYLSIYKSDSSPSTSISDSRHLKENLLSLSTTSLYLNPLSISNFKRLQDLTLWWRLPIFSYENDKDKPQIKDLSKLPSSLRSLRLYIPITKMFIEISETIRRTKTEASYIMTVSKIFSNLISENSNLKVEICIVDLIGKDAYLAVIRYDASKQKIHCFQKPNDYQTILEELPDIIAKNRS